MNHHMIDPGSRRRLTNDWLKATATPPWTGTPQGPFWRIVPAVYYYKRGKQRRWVIYRNGVRMWTKTSSDAAVDYVSGNR